MTLRLALISAAAAHAAALTSIHSAGLRVPHSIAASVSEQHSVQTPLRSQVMQSQLASNARPMVASTLATRAAIPRMASRPYTMKPPPVKAPPVKASPEVCAVEGALAKDACPIELVPVQCFGEIDLAMGHVETSTADATAIEQARGIQSTTRLEGFQNDGCSWLETSEMVTAEVQIPGLRGQPAGCLGVHLQTSRDAQRCGLGTVTVMAFGRAAWGCALRGAIVPDMCSVVAEDGPHMLPLIRISVRKTPGSPQWGGFISSIDTDCLLQ